MFSLTSKSNLIRQISSLHGQMTYLLSPVSRFVDVDTEIYVLFTLDDPPVVRVT